LKAKCGFEKGVKKMESTFERLLAELEVLEPVNVNGFQVFGLRRPDSTNLSYLTLDEALQEELVDVTEISEGGSVPVLRVSNRAESLLFLMSGEQLRGAKQNRVLNVSMMVDSKTEIPIPVSCVEAGRWQYQSRKFTSSGTSSHSYLRAMMARDVSASYRQNGSPTSNQGAVWEEIGRKLGRMGSRSRSSALNQVYEDYDAKLKKFIQAVKVPADCCGAVFSFKGEIAGMDLFDRRVTFEKLWPKLVRSYAIDAFEQSEPSSSYLTREAVSLWLNTASTAKSERFPSPGIGEDIRLESNIVVGSSLLVGDKPVHMELFARVAPPFV
jgi:hypothetical protein